MFLPELHLTGSSVPYEVASSALDTPAGIHLHTSLSSAFPFAVLLNTRARSFKDTLTWQIAYMCRSFTQPSQMKRRGMGGGEEAERERTKALFRDIHKSLFTIAPHWKQLRYPSEENG